jgi:hypothetical protein
MLNDVYVRRPGDGVELAYQGNYGGNEDFRVSAHMQLDQDGECLNVDMNAG